MLLQIVLKPNFSLGKLTIILSNLKLMENFPCKASCKLTWLIILSLQLYRPLVTALNFLFKDKKKGYSRTDQQRLAPRLKRQLPGNHRVQARMIQSEIQVDPTYSPRGQAGEDSDQNHLKPYSKANSWKISPPSQLNITLSNFTKVGETCWFDQMYLQPCRGISLRVRSFMNLLNRPIIALL